MQCFQRWKAKACPCFDECSAQAWARADAKSYVSEEDCRNKVAQHLLRSSLHKSIATMAEAQLKASSCEIEVESWTQEEVDEWEREQNAAMEKKEKEKRKWDWGADTQRQEGTKRVATSAVAPPGGGTPVGSTSSGAGGGSSTGHELQRRQAQGTILVMPEYDLPPEITLSREICQAVLENIDRTKAALDMACQTAEGAANVFRAEIVRVTGVEQRIRTHLGQR